MHARTKGRSSSKHPPIKAKPSWVDLKEKEIRKIIVDLYNDGYSIAKIGEILRDQYGVPGTKYVLGKKLTAVLEEEGITIKYPEDLLNLMKKAVNLRKHLEEHKKDLHNKRGLTLIESKIRRLVKYYKKVGKLPKDWKYDPKAAELIVRGR